MPDEVARIGALSNGSNGQRSLESASLHFERYCEAMPSGSRQPEAECRPLAELYAAGQKIIRQYRLNMPQH
jgi:hypothetical protein